MLTYNDNNEEQQNDNEDSKEGYMEKNKNKASLLEKALQWKEK